MMIPLSSFILPRFSLRLMLAQQRRTKSPSSGGVLPSHPAEGRLYGKVPDNP